MVSVRNSLYDFKIERWDHESAAKAGSAGILARVSLWRARKLAGKDAGAPSPVHGETSLSIVIVDAKDREGNLFFGQMLMRRQRDDGLAVGLGLRETSPPVAEVGGG